jgi:hypothetical protein
LNVVVGVNVGVGTGTCIIIVVGIRAGAIHRASRSICTGASTEIICGH